LRLLGIRFASEDVRDVSVLCRFGIVSRPPSVRQIASRALAEILRCRFVARLDRPVHWRSVFGARSTSTKDRQIRHQHMLVFAVIAGAVAYYSSRAS
jgi:hypothetical protein